MAGNKIVETWEWIEVAWNPLIYLFIVKDRCIRLAQILMTIFQHLIITLCRLTNNE